MNLTGNQGAWLCLVLFLVCVGMYVQARFRLATPREKQEWEQSWSPGLEAFFRSKGAREDWELETECGCPGSGENEPVYMGPALFLGVDAKLRDIDGNLRDRDGKRISGTDNTVFAPKGK